MRKLVTGAVAAATLSASMVAATAPAQAQWRHGGWGGGHGGWGGGRHHGGGAGVAIGAGVLGLALGAAVASRPRYYDGPGPGAYGYAPPPPGYYGGYGGDYVEYCRTGWRWDGYRGRYVRVRYCD